MIEVSPLVLAALLGGFVGGIAGYLAAGWRQRRKPMANPYAGPQQARGPGSHP